MIYLRDIEGGFRGLVGGLAVFAGILLLALFCFVGAWHVGVWVWALA